MKKNYRLFFLFTVPIFLFGLTSLSACSNNYGNKTEEERLQFQKIENEDEYCVTGLGTVSSSDIVIPNVYDGLPVTMIANEAFKSCSQLTSVVIPDGITVIGDSAFYNCRGLTEISLPNSVNSIGFSAFYNCSKLKSLELPFIGATKNSTINSHFGYIFGANSYDANNDYVPFSLKTVSVTGAFPIGSSAFYCCRGLTNVMLPDGINSINNSVFAGCATLISVNIPDSVTSIGNSAFRSCDSLTCITIPNKVVSIGKSVFYGCNSLTDISFTGTTEEWENVEKGTNWNYEIATTVLICKDGNVNME